MKTPVPTLHLPHSPARARSRPRATSRGTPKWLVNLVLVVALVFAGTLGISQLRTPDVVPASAPASAFSAERALTYLEVVAAESRAIGMPGHDAVRDYLVAELQAMGLSPELQTTTGTVRFEGATDFSAGTVTNIVARIAGTASTGAIALNAHYDSGATGPAASDNGSGVVTVLETVRAILAGEPLQNDIIIVFSDGEEHGDLGAAAFTQQHPWADDVRLAINFEAQGRGGPALLYATSDDDGWLAARYFDIAPWPAGYSLLPELVRQLPGMRLACDLEDYLINGSAGLGFVYVEDSTAYHTERDSLATIDRGTLQQEGENTLAVTLAFGNSDLNEIATGTNRVFFTILPGVVLHYGGQWVIPLAAVVTVILLTLLIVGVRRDMLSWRGLLVGAVAFPVAVIAAVMVASLLWMGMRAFDSSLQITLIGSYQNTLHVTALSLAAVATMTAAYALLRQRVRTTNLLMGAAIGWALMMWSLSLLAPGASYLATWPLLFGMLPLAWSLFAPTWDDGWARIGVLVLALLPAIVLIPGTWHQMVALLNRMDYFAAFGSAIPMLGLWAIFIAPLVALALPHLSALDGDAGDRRAWMVPGVAVVTTIALLGWGSATASFDADHPRTNHIAYEYDADTGEARWVTTDDELDAWTSQFFAGDVTRGEIQIDGNWTAPGLVAPAVAVPIAVPEVTVEADQAVDGVRTVTIRLTSPREAAELGVTVRAEGDIVAATVNGQVLDLAGYSPATIGELILSYAHPGAEGILLTLEVRSAEAIAIDVHETSYGLPEIPGMTITARPDDMMPAPGLPLDATVVRKTFNI